MRFPRAAAALVLLSALAVCGGAAAGDGIDVDLWHRQLAEELGPEPEAEPEQNGGFGLFPTLGLAAGPPNWISAQAHLFASFSDGRRFSVYGGLGLEEGPQADALILTLGWGGVRPVIGLAPQLAFHGKYLRYRRWDDRDHGIHHGLSLGTESGLGFAAAAFELGAARSDRNHWLVTATVCLKLAAPVHLPLARGVEAGAPGS
jgi:hypothetical protein